MWKYFMPNMKLLQAVWQCVKETAGTVVVAKAQIQ